MLVNIPLNDLLLNRNAVKIIKSAVFTFVALVRFDLYKHLVC